MKTPVHILQKIAQNRTTQAKILDLRKQTLLEIPPEVFELTHLEELWLARNALKRVPASLQQLRHLKIIDVRENPLIQNYAAIANIAGLVLDWGTWQHYKSELAPENIAGLWLRLYDDNFFEELLKLPNLRWLDLSHNWLKELPPQLSQFTQLSTLYLSDNQLSSVKELGSLTNLSTLDLRNNKLSSVKELGSLTNLSTLDLRNNKLSSVKELGSLTNLSRLDLRNNQLSSVKELGSLTNLSTLDLSSNKLSSVKELGSLTNLSTLDLSSNQLSSVKELGSLTNLSTLYLSYNHQLSSVKELGSLTNLSTLYLSYNQLSSVKELGSLTNLSTLDLSYNQLSSVKELGSLTNLSTLDLSSNQLSSVKELGSLTNLSTLYLRNNKLSSVKELGSLTNLSTLDLSYNQLSSVKELGSLTNLSTLYLSYNHQLSSVKELGSLTNLSTLYLSYNQLSSVKELGSLTNLSTLDLSYNQLSSVKELGSLTNLSTLDLSDNQLSSVKELGSLTNLSTLYLSYNQLSSVKELGTLQNLRQLSLGNNPLTEPPIETLESEESDSGYVNITALFRYYKQLDEQGKDYLYEAKLLIIGKGGAGKTSLLTKMLDPTQPLPKAEDSTHGIDIKPWSFTVDTDKQFRVNVWDFGGQAIYHATHRYFLSSNALYVLVVDVRKDSEQSTLDLEIYWWLHAVELWGGNSPVLLLQNDTGGRLLEIDMGTLRKEFDFLDNKTHKINLATVTNTEHEDFNRILAAFQFQFRQLPNFRKPLPKIWVEIRQFVEEQKQCNWINYRDFIQVCQNKRITQEEDAKTLLSTFHELGICLWFQDHDYLKKIVIVNPSWATNSAYAVLQNDAIKQNYGRFSKQDLQTIWCESYYKDMQGELLDLMKKFELCYELPEKDKFIAPQLLKNERPNGYTFNEQDLLQVYYTYDNFMPKGILHRLMVILHELIAEERQYVWLTGVVFKQAHAQAEVIEKYAEKKIQIRVTGNSKDKRDLMSIILFHIDKLNESFNRFHKLQCDKLIPCQCTEFKNDPEFFPYQELKEFANDNAPIQCRKRGCRKMLDAQTLLDGISSEKSTKKTNTEQSISKPKGGDSVTNINIYHSNGVTINSGHIGGDVINSIQQLPPEQRDSFEHIRKLLTDSELPNESKDKALDMLKQLAESSQQPESERKSIFEKATGFFEGIATFMQQGVELKELVSEISKWFS